MTASQTDLSVIIVSYNVRFYLEQCLRSVFAAGQGLRMEVLVVDNASPDATLDFLKERFPQAQWPALRLIDAGANLGFGKANNLALAQAKGEFILFLNPDTLLGEDTLHQAIAFARQHPDLGALGTRMLNDNGSFAPESHRGVPSPWVAFCKMSGLASLFPKSRRFGRYYMRYLDEDQAAPIDIVSGAFMLIPKAALEETGSFDETFFMYGEDIDLSYRLLKSGRQNYYLPATILHYKGESTSKTSYRYVQTFYGAMLIFFRKHYPHAHFISIPIHLAVMARATMTYVWGNLRRLLHIRKRGRGHTDLPRYTFTTDRERLADLPPGYVTFHLGTHTRHETLEWLRTSDHRHYLAFYDPETGVTVTGADTRTDNPAPYRSQTPHPNPQAR